MSRRASQGSEVGIHPAFRHGRGVAWLSLLLALAVLAGTVFLGSIYLRQHLREHLLQRDGEILYSVALGKQLSNGTTAEGLAERLKDPAEQLDLALEISQIREGVLAVRLLDAGGGFVTGIPPEVRGAVLSPSQLSKVRAFTPVTEFFEYAQWTDFFLHNELGPGPNMPLLVVTIPLHARGDTYLCGVAQLVLHGRDISHQYARIDQHLTLLASGLFLAGALLLSGILLWAYRRLQAVQGLLRDRTERLLRANHELALAAKSSAVGAVSAHLIHGLSNPLANLHDFIVTQTGKPDGNQDLQDLASATRRMQQLVNDVVRVLAEQEGKDSYELSLQELTSVLRKKLEQQARSCGVHVMIKLEAEGQISNHHANLTLLILENLMQNAVRVSPRGASVVVSLRVREGGLRVEVRDNGSGIPAHVQAALFRPCRSTHGGSGLGLAISRQLAAHMGAELALDRTGPEGSVFKLQLPETIIGALQPTTPLQPCTQEVLI